MRGRQAVGRGRAEINRGEPVVGELGDVALGADLRGAIGRDRVQLARLLDHLIAGKAVIAARGGEQEALDLGCLGDAGEMHAAAVVDAVGRVRIEIAERVVGQSREMNDCVEPIKVAHVGVAQIFADMRHLGDLAAGGKGAALIELAVETGHLMACLDQHRHHDRADIAQMPSDQHAHDCFSLPFATAPAACVIRLSGRRLPRSLATPCRDARACCPARPCPRGPPCPSGCPSGARSLHA